VSFCFVLFVWTLCTILQIRWFYSDISLNLARRSGPYSRGALPPAGARVEQRPKTQSDYASAGLKTLLVAAYLRTSWQHISAFPPTFPMTQNASFAYRFRCSWLYAVPALDSWRPPPNTTVRPRVKHSRENNSAFSFFHTRVYIHTGQAQWQL